MQNINDPSFAGVLKETASAAATNFDAQEDLDGERETLADRVVELATLQATLAEASKGVTEQTHKEYMRLMDQCTKFLRALKLIGEKEVFFSSTPTKDAPEFISAWILSQCDSIKLDGSARPANEERLSYSHAQKMRAAATYGFGRIHGLGNVPWMPGLSQGNPSCSIPVSNYMMSLQRRKVRAGEVAVSARSITPEIMQRLYDFNHAPANWTIRPYQPAMRDDPDANANWGGGRCRRLLQAAYTIAFLCLLRFDEVLKIQVHDIDFDEEEAKMTIRLPFRKTDQGGEIKPFVIFALSEAEAHLCPVRSVAEWLVVSNIKEGFLFRNIMSGDRVSTENVYMTASRFLELFRNNLLDLGINCDPYGTHSFRRGGCQYLASRRRWHLRRICEWGGWSSEFSHMTIVKYLISNSDEPAYSCEDFFNPKYQPVLKCFTCGRSCDCA